MTHDDPRYTFNFKMTVNKIQDMQEQIYGLIKDRGKMIDYIIVKSEKSVTLAEKLRIPTEIKKPIEFDEKMYPLAENGKSFKINHQYDYLATFRVGSFYEKMDEKDPRYGLIRDMIESNQCQSRLSNIWRQVAGVILTFDKIFSEVNIFRGILSKMLQEMDEEYNNAEYPFYENRILGRIKFEHLKVVSIMPLLIYALCHIGSNFIMGNVDEDEMMMCMNNYLLMAKESYQDEKLRIKGIARNWINEALDVMGRTMTPIWTPDMCIQGYRMKETREYEIVRRGFTKAREERKRELSEELNNYINMKINRSRNQAEITRAYVVTRLATNDGTYFKTATELSLKKAVEPTIRQKIVPAPKPTEKTSDGVLRQIYESETIYDEIVKYLLAFKNKVIKTLNDIKLDEEYLDILKMTSAGVKLDEQEASDKVMSVLLKKRIPRAAMDSAEYRNIIQFVSRLQAPIFAVERQQIDRRQRMIAGINNEGLLGSMASYVILTSLFKYMSAAAQGKQSGSAVDISDMLELSSLENVMLSSMDVKGMDAAIQPTTRDIIHTFELEIARLTRHNVAGPFKEKWTKVIDDKGETIEENEYVNALMQLLMIERHNTQTAVTYVSTAFGEMVNAEGTFSSGRADTSAHHTALLPGIIRGIETMNSEITPSCRAMVRAMGDDANIVYSGSEELMEKNVEDDKRAMNELGFDIDEELSRSSMVFLQQQCVNGCFVGYPDRIAIFTKEHSNEVTSIYQSVQELRALCDDMCWRIRNTRGLKLLMTCLGAMCSLRVTIEVESARAKEIITEMGKIVPCHGYEDTRDTAEKGRKQRKELMSFYLPLMWLYIEKGGEFPCFSVERSDGSFTEEESIHTPRGKMKRKLMYDISYNKESKKMTLDRKILKDIGITAALKIIKLNIVGNEYMIKRETFDDRKLEKMGRSLEGITNNDRYNRSRQHANILRENGFVIPKQAVLGERLTERITQTIEKIPLSKNQMRMFGEGLLREIKRYKNYVVEEYKDDVVYKCRLIEKDERIGIANIKFLVHGIEIAPNVQPGTESTTALQYIGMMDKISGGVRNAVNAVRGTYGSFRYDDPTFEAGYKIWRSRGDMIEHFFKAIDASPDREEAYKNAFAYYARNEMHQYLLSLSPRNQFFIRDDATKLMLYVDDLPAVARVDLLYGILVAEVLRGSFWLTGGRITLMLDDELKRHLKEVALIDTGAVQNPI
ncbi:RNA-dependent RNA polymerase [Hubei lepidoptera virus 3]|uniref:RNA-dependent RNA polymerase n=1 Tax=Hubei lepidoptera virus 3 TaxID=1922905 RepID=UPI00090B2F7A|nr:RNA-dependent RNA polymerase [Hubei lepidoptera virus 3]APG79093.1 RNA-dependent RNA polymerase [Hubei lepidoptera virus 3]